MGSESEPDGIAVIPKLIPKKLMQYLKWIWKFGLQSHLDCWIYVLLLSVAELKEMLKKGEKKEKCMDLTVICATSAHH